MISPAPFRRHHTLDSSVAQTAPPLSRLSRFLSVSPPPPSRRVGNCLLPYIQIPMTGGGRSSPSPSSSSLTMWHLVATCEIQISGTYDGQLSSPHPSPPISPPLGKGTQLGTGGGINHGGVPASKVPYRNIRKPGKACCYFLAVNYMQEIRIL